MVQTKDTLWADVITDRELSIKKKVTHCETCGKKLRKDRPDYFTRWCSTKCKMEAGKMEADQFK